MKIFNITLNKMAGVRNTRRAVVHINEDTNVIEFGYVSNSDPNLINIIFKTNERIGGLSRQWLLINDNTKDKIEWSNQDGYYFIPSQYSEEEVLRMTNVFGHGGFPYNFERHYEAAESFNIFDCKQVVRNETNYNLSKYLKYTFGVEFETSMGYVPEKLCFEDGIIPLRDGSISGLEYSTVVLQGNIGLNLLKQQVDDLSKYTFFNKECALHIHMGGYPVDPKAIFVLYTVMCLLEEDIYNIVPAWTFNTARYKKSGKDYCKFLPRFASFNSLYEGIANQRFLGDLYQPHPYDVDRQHKWECHSRYVFFNILNMLCYRSCKTVEFRFLRPTFNYNKITLWLYIFNGILMYAEKLSESIKNLNDLDIIKYIRDHRPYLKDIMSSVYPTDVASKVNLGITKLNIAVRNQNANEDYIGKDIELENRLFTEII